MRLNPTRPVESRAADDLQVKPGLMLVANPASPHASKQQGGSEKQEGEINVLEPGVRRGSTAVHANPRGVRAGAF